MFCGCGKPSDGWPGELCQDCWESECSESWWLMCDQLYQASFPALTKAEEPREPEQASLVELGGRMADEVKQ